MKTLKINPIIAVSPFVLIAAVLQFVIPAISYVYPNLAHVLSLVSIGCCIAILLIWALVFGKHLIDHRGKAVQTWWRDLWTHLSQLTHKEKASTLVPVEQLSQFRDQVQRFGLALHGMTPEQERARRTHFQMRGEQVPALVLPQQNAVLYAEYDGLIKALTLFGFPALERVYLEQGEFEVFQQWERDLEKRLQQLQQRFQAQQYATRLAMSAVKRLHESIGVTYPAAILDSGYLRLQGALKLLEKQWQDNRSSDDLIQSCALKLQRDMEALIQELQQKVA